MGNGTHCDDINECLAIENSNEYLCNNTGVCKNSIGYYYCECQSGYMNAENSSVCIGNINCKSM